VVINIAPFITQVQLSIRFDIESRKCKPTPSNLDRNIAKFL